MKYYENSPIVDEFELHFLLTGKYELVYSYRLNRISIYKKHILWSNRILRYYKDRDPIGVFNGALAFQILPHFDELISCHKFMSEKIIDRKIERLLNMRIFM